MTLAGRLREALAARAGSAVPHAGDMPFADDARATPAAVLIALTERPAPGVILTQRPATMRQHAGQVALPGGRVDPDDADCIAAALREAEEEVALAPAAVEVVGTLPAYRTITGFSITPVVGVIAPDLPLVPHEAEVEAVFEVPLDVLRDATRWQERSIRIAGTERRYRELVWAERRIWGATAAILANFTARLP